MRGAALGQGRRLAIYAIVVAQLATASCARMSTYHGPTAAGGLVGGLISTLDVGQIVFEVVKASIERDAATGPARVAALEARHADFTGAVNTILNARSLAGLGPTLQVMIDLTDDDTLPKLAENVATVMESLLSEPGHPTLRAFLDAGDARLPPLQADDALAFAARTINYAEFERLLESIARLIEENDGRNGRPALGTAAQDVFARRLRAAAQPPPPPGGPPGLLTGVTDELLVAAPPRVGGSFGPAAPAVRVDAHGNAAVAVDPATGRLYAPFTDANADGAADIDAAGDPVDAAGAPIAIPPFAAPSGPGRDAEGRALALDGRPLYVYFDAKQTLLSHFLQLFGEALRRRVDAPAIDLLNIAAGPRATRDNGTPGDPSDDWSGFARDNPLLDLVWAAIELLKLPEAPKLFRALAEVNRLDPAFSEKLFVTYGRIVELMRPVSSGPTAAPTAADRASSDRLIELFDAVFNDGRTPSTGRLLFQVLHDLGLTARQLPRQLALMVEYSNLAVDPAGNPIPHLSTRVDFARAPTLPGSPLGENRSILHQLLDLFANADGCQTFIFAGKPLSESLLDLMAGNSVGTLQTLIGFIDFPLVRLLISIACPQIQASLDSVKGLSASGALAGFVPICKVFVDRGQGRLLVDILKTIQARYDGVRAAEPRMIQLLNSGAVDPIFDLDDLLVAGRGGGPLTDPLTHEPAVDVIVDLLGKLLARPGGGVPDRRGIVRPTRIHLLAEPLRRLDDAVWAATGGQAIQSTLYYALTDLFVERLDNDRLVNQSVTPFLAHVLDKIAGNLPQDAAQRAARLTTTQQEAVDALESRDFAVILDLATMMRTAASADPVRDAIANMLTPNVQARDDVFGSLLRLLVTVLQSHVDGAPLRTIAGFIGRLFDPAAGHFADALTGVSRLFTADRGRVVLGLLRNGVNEAPAEAGIGPRVPLDLIAEVMDAVDAAGRRARGGRAVMTPDQELQAAIADVTDAVAFIRDDTSGLARVFRFVKTRGR